MVNSKMIVAPRALFSKHSLLGYCLRSLLRAVSTLLLATFSAFMALRIAPADPLTMLAAGRQLDPALEAAWRLRYGFGQSVIVQYLIYIRNLLHGDFGLSYYYAGKPVVALIEPALRMTIQWQIPALALAILGAVALAMATSNTRSRWVDSATNWLH